MENTLLRILRTGLCILTPFFLISNNTVHRGFYETGGFSDNPSLMATGDYAHDLNGEVSFETNIETSGGREQFFTLQLDLSQEGIGGNDAFGFLISHKMGKVRSGVGTFEVVADPDGFLNDFDGVFGFANIQSVSEAPFFAQNGKITIYNMDKDTATGAIAVTLLNSDGKRIKVTGNFKAKRSQKKEHNTELVSL
jgi:hypothetical protein